MQRNTPRKLAIPSGVPPSLLPDLVLDVQQAVLDPGAELDVRAHGLGIEELRERELDLLVDFAELGGVLDGRADVRGGAGERTRSAGEGFGGPGGGRGEEGVGGGGGAEGGGVGGGDAQGEAALEDFLLRLEKLEALHGLSPIKTLSF